MFSRLLKEPIEKERSDLRSTNGTRSSGAPKVDLIFDDRKFHSFKQFVSRLKVLTSQTEMGMHRVITEMTQSDGAREEFDFMFGV